MLRKIPFNRKLLSSCIAASLVLGADVSLAQEELEEVLVTGIRSSLDRAIDIKREAVSVVDSISAEDIGKLPDVTVTDALQRVTGVQIRRDAGEGTTVNVRGTPQVAVFLNGEQYLSAGAIESAQPDFADIPAELLSGVDVIKSSEAKTLSGGMSGTINLKSRRPFELVEGWTFAGLGEINDGSYVSEKGHKVAAFAGFNDDKFGALLTVSESNANLANYRYGMFNDWWYRGYHEDGSWPGYPEVDVTGDGDTNDAILGTIDYGITNRTSERDRLGINGTLQFQATDNVELIADIFYTKMDQYQRANGLVADNAWAEYDWLKPLQLTNRGPSAEGHTNEDLYTTTVFDLNALRVTAKAESRVEKRESLNTNFQANFIFSDNLTATARYIHANAENNSTANIADANITSGAQHGLNTRVAGVEAPVHPSGEGPGRVLVHADMSGTYPSYVYPDGFANELSDYGLVSTFSDLNVNEESTLDVFRFDGKLEFDNGSFEFGYRYHSRDVSREDYDFIAPFTDNDADGNPTTAYAKWKDSGLAIAGDGSDTIGKTWNFTELDSMGYIHQLSDFGPASSGESYYFIDPEVLDDAYGFQESLYPGNTTVINNARSYEINEKSHTGYIQTNLSGELGVPYDANFGVQIVRTFLDIDQVIAGPDNSVVYVDGQEYPGIGGARGPAIGDRETKRNYTDFLPRFNVSFDIQEDMKLRFAYTKTMTQLSANDLGLGLSLTFNNNTDLGVFEVVSGSQDGNPDMNPWRANNYDLSYEWYFSETSIIAAGLFYFEVDEYIATQTEPVQGVPDSDGVVRNNGIDVTSRVNAEGGTIQGMELGYQQAFDFLPGVLSGLGATLNYTWADGEGGDNDFYGSRMPIADYSEHQFNGILWYEYEGLQARLAYNYRSERYIGKPWNDGHPAAWWSAPTSYIDASVSYQFMENYTVYLQGSNITEEYEESYMQWEDVIVNQNVYEARYALGLRVKF
ncbi:TonB-dependent receptor [Teredinibacter haidensis]|uniref:TonB-dependent receptor n=1 Tax=Teredinibacter haidensis TaxID=2731755 RepID=UPI000948DEEE|nr:TonB-dependent receptor [Teredinibacter haidensis]